MALPNLNEAIRDLNGRLLPFGWLRLLWRLKVAGVHSARVPLMGLRRSFSQGLLGSLVPFLLIDAVRREGRQARRPPRRAVLDPRGQRADAADQ